MTANETDTQSIGPNQWAAPRLHARTFPDRETRREIVRERVAASQTARKRLFAITIVLIAVSTALGVVAAYHWERGKDAAAAAAAIAAQNDALAARVTELESLSDGLADMVALAFAHDPQELLAQLGDLEERRPAAADTTTFAKLWIGAKDRETQNQPGFETANGADPTQSDVTAEPAPQDQAKGDVAKPDQTSVAPAPTETRVARAEPGAANPRDTLRPAERSDANLRQSDIAIRAIAESWIQIVDASGTPMFTKLLKDGDVHSVPAAAGALLITGNPTGLALTVDGVPAPAFNAKGPTRREIALDPARLLGGTAEEPAKRPVPATP